LWAKTDNYAGKVLFIKAGERLSLQHHEVKEETIMLWEGKMILYHGPSLEQLSELVMNDGDVFHIKPKYIHRMLAITDCSVFEVSTTELDDVVRHKDDYGRAE
jgi:mannose-6-phosphate isomerase